MITQLFHAARGSITAWPHTTSTRGVETRVDNSPHDTRTESDFLAFACMRIHRFSAGQAFVYVHTLTHANINIYFNRKYDRVGTLFQDRFKSEPIDTDSYLMTVVRYIHQNPVKAGISRTCEYRWSSYQEYAHNNRKLCNTAFVISVFGGTSWLILYHNEIADADKCMAPEVRWRMSDGEVARLVRRAFRRFGLPDASGAVKAKRDAVIRKLLADGVPVNQLARVLGVGRAVVRYA